MAGLLTMLKRDRNTAAFLVKGSMMDEWVEIGSRSRLKQGKSGRELNVYG
jgi:hypothetical protein